jgi:hypothetical protein
VPAQYLLPCSCGRKTPVETRQAGETVVCGCGLKLDVPRLLELKRLEKTAVGPAPRKSSFAWGTGHSLVSVGVLVFSVAAVVGIWFLILTPNDPYSTMTPEQIHADFQKMPPWRTWDMWMYLKHSGLNPRKDYGERLIEQLFEIKKMLLIFVGTFALGGAAMIGGGAYIMRKRRSKVRAGTHA